MKDLTADQKQAAVLEVLRDFNASVQTLREIMGASPTPAPVVTPTPRAKAASKIAASSLPESAELNSLQGQCQTSAQRIVRSHAKRGVDDMREYVAKLQTFQGPNPSARFRYASAMLAALDGTSKKPSFKPSKKIAELLARASVPAKGKQTKTPGADADLSAWRTYVIATQDVTGLSAAGIRTRAWRARENAAGRDPYRSTE